jgi:hypothetical protein
MAIPDSLGGEISLALKAEMVAPEDEHILTRRLASL